MDEIKLLGIIGDEGIVDTVIADPNWKSPEKIVLSIGAVAWVQRQPEEDDQAFEQRAKIEAEQMTKEVRENIKQSQ